MFALESSRGSGTSSPQIAGLQNLARGARAALDADQLLGAPLLVLETADGEVAAADAELLADPLERLQRRNLLLVHPVDEDRTLRVLLVAEALAHDEVLGTLLDLHRKGRTPSAPGR
jgi:hypothetical protein